MSIYDTIERSPRKGKPIRAYHFFQGANEWFYTSARAALTLLDEIYEPLEIKHGVIEGGGEDAPGELEIELPTDSDLGLVIQAGTAATPINVRIYRVHRQALSDPKIIHLGELGAVEVEGEVMKLTSVPLRAQMDLDFPFGVVKKNQCAWYPYDANTCKVDPSDFTFTGIVATINGLWITVTGAQAFVEASGVPEAYWRDFFSLGVMTKGERKGMIEEQNGDQVRLMTSMPTLIVGDTVSLLAGDDLTKETCHNKFNNSLRRLSHPNLPLLNPAYGQGLRV